MSRPETIHSVNRSKNVKKLNSACCTKPVRTIEGADYGWCSQCRKPQDLTLRQRRQVPKTDLDRIVGRELMGA